MGRNKIEIEISAVRGLALILGLGLSLIYFPYLFPYYFPYLLILLLLHLSLLVYEYYKMFAGGQAVLGHTCRKSLLAGLANFPHSDNPVYQDLA